MRRSTRKPALTLAQAKKRMREVIDLHHPADPRGEAHDRANDALDWTHCFECGAEWPCDTVSILRGNNA